MHNYVLWQKVTVPWTLIYFDEKKVLPILMNHNLSSPELEYLPSSCNKQRNRLTNRVGVGRMAFQKQVVSPGQKKPEVEYLR
jgi:hypothetical protein